VILGVAAISGVLIKI